MLPPRQLDYHHNNDAAALNASLFMKSTSDLTAGTDYSMLDFTTFSPTAAASTFHLNTTVSP
jgi:hypothetical protein